MKSLVAVAALGAAVTAHAAALVCGGVGAYVADVDVVVTPLQGAEAGVRAKADGPLCMLALVPGRYRIDATYNGAKRSATAVVPATSARPAHVGLGFPQSAADGDLDLKPSAEEKMQAKQP